MIYKVALTLSIGILITLGQIYPPPGDELETPEVGGTAVPLLVTATPSVTTPYPAHTPDTPAGENQLAPAAEVDTPRLIGGDNQQTNAGPGQPRAAATGQAESSGSLLYLWVAFLAALALFLAGVAGSALLFTRRPAHEKESR